MNNTIPNAANDENGCVLHVFSMCFVYGVFRYKTSFLRLTTAGLQYFFTVKSIA